MDTPFTVISGLLPSPRTTAHALIALLLGVLIGGDALADKTIAHSKSPLVGVQVPGAAGGKHQGRPEGRGHRPAFLVEPA